MSEEQQYDREAKFRDLLADRYGWGPWDVAKLHPSEIEMYLHGAELRNEEQQRAAQRGSAPSADQRRREEQALQKYA